VTITNDSESVHVWDLRSIRKQLKELGLDWDAPPCPPVPSNASAVPLHMEVDLAQFNKPSLFTLAGAKQIIQERLQQVKSNPNNASACNNLAWAYLMAPEPLRDTKAALPLAKKAVQLAPDNPNCRNTLGVAYYRSGQYQLAIDTLLPNLKNKAHPLPGWDLFYLAMSHHQLGETTQANLYQELALLWLKSKEDLPAELVEELAAIRAEAEQVLGLANKSAGPAPKMSSKNGKAMGGAQAGAWALEKIAVAVRLLQVQPASVF
jgi:tetratricopeptide (TPR) repeat protein